MKRALLKFPLYCLSLWPLAIALPLFALVLADRQFFSGSTSFVWLARVTFYHSGALALCYVPVSVLLVFVYLLLLDRRRIAMRVPICGASLSLILLVLVNLGMCAFSVFTFMGSYRYHDEARLDNQVYRLDSEWKVGVGGDSKAIFSQLQCERRGMICKTVYIYRYESRDPESFVSEQEFRTVKASLRPDAQAHSITMIINGQIVHTYFPP